MVVARPCAMNVASPKAVEATARAICSSGARMTAAPLWVLTPHLGSVGSIGESFQIAISGFRTESSAKKSPASAQRGSSLDGLWVVG